MVIRLVMYRVITVIHIRILLVVDFHIILIMDTGHWIIHKLIRIWELQKILKNL